MTVGLQVWDQFGRLMLDATHRLGRIKGIQRIEGFAASFPCDMSDGTPFWSFQPDQQFFHISGETASPIITISSTGVSWIYSSTAGLDHPGFIKGTVIFGVY